MTELHKLAIKYPELLPLRYAELKRYPFPLIYFSRDARTDIVRGIIVADEIDGSWVKSLVEKELPLDKPLRYEDRQLKKIETK